LTGKFLESGGISSAGGDPAFPFSAPSSPEVFPPEPPVAEISRPQRRAAGKGAPLFGAAKRTLAGEHRCGITGNLDGRRSGNTFLLVSFERFGLDSRADDSGGTGATIDHSDIRGSEPHGHDPSGAASD